VWTSCSRNVTQYVLCYNKLRLVTTRFRDALKSLGYRSNYTWSWQRFTAWSPRKVTKRCFVPLDNNWTDIRNFVIEFYYSFSICSGADKSLSFYIFLFAAQPKEFFLDGLKKLEQRSHKCVELRGEYVNTFFFNPIACFLYKAKDLSAPLVYGATYNTHSGMLVPATRLLRSTVSRCCVYSCCDNFCFCVTQAQLKF
jgi:hypothetical protein